MHCRARARRLKISRDHRDPCYPERQQRRTRSPRPRRIRLNRGCDCSCARPQRGCWSLPLHETFEEFQRFFLRPSRSPNPVEAYPTGVARHRLFYQVPAHLIVQEYHVGTLVEAQHRQITPNPFVSPPTSRHDLNGDIGALRGLQKVIELGTHDLQAADPAMENELIQHHPQQRWPTAYQDFLPLHPGREKLVDLLRRLTETEYRTGVVLRLQQAGYEGQREGSDGGGFGFEVGVGAEPVGQSLLVDQVPELLEVLVGAEEPVERDGQLLGRATDGELDLADEIAGTVHLLP